MTAKKPTSLLLDAIAAETNALAQQQAETQSEAPCATEDASADADDTEDSSVDEPWDPDAERPNRPAWLGRSSADLLSGKGARIGSTTDVHTGGAKIIEPDKEGS
jgi:hypothetical protein